MCEQRRRLVEIYQAAVDRYLDAVREQRSRTATTPRNEYFRLVEESESRRKQSEAARQALIAHVQEHGCNSE